MLDAESRSPRSLLAAAVPIYWRLTGNIALLLVAAVAGLQPLGSWADYLYALVVLSLLLARFLSVTWLKNSPTEDEPTTTRSFFTYAAILLPSALALWLAVHWAEELAIR